MSILGRVDWRGVRSHYDQRVKESKNLQDLFKMGKVKQFAELALGIEVPAGNYSAAEHHLGPRILENNVNANQRVFDLAEKFVPLKVADAVPELVRSAQLSYLQIGVGSEISCMNNPAVCWVCNTRTIWTYLAWEGTPARAEEALQLYRTGDTDSEMAYMNWADVYHPLLKEPLRQIADEGGTISKKAGVTAGELSYLWADAIASEVYDQYHSRKSNSAK